MTSSFENPDARLILKPGREKSLERRHPWVFSGGIKEVEGSAKAGDIIAVHSHKQELLGRGFFNPRSQIRLRILDFQDREINADWFRNKIRAAIELRSLVLNEQTNACRLIHGEADGLPGIILDKYDNVLVLQFHALGARQHRDLIIAILQEVLQPAAILERSDSGSGKLEGLSRVKEWVFGDEQTEVEILENGVRFVVDVVNGQKTGFFLDQRENRERIGKLAAGKNLLNCFSYSGGFSLYAALAGARTTAVDSSGAAIALAGKNMAVNGLDVSDHRLVTANVFDFLRESQEVYDVIVLDPPAFVKNRQQINQGARGYKDINRLAIRNVRPGGLIMTCSCSSFVDWDLFGKIIFSAALEANRNVNVIGRYGQPADHPVSVFFPEGEYLKTLLLQVSE